MVKRTQSSTRRPPAERSPAEQVDQVVEKIMAGANPRPRVSSTLAALLQIASDLRDLPRADFKTRLLDELSSIRKSKPRAKQAARPASRASEATKYIPQGVHAATPCLVLRDPNEAIEFYARAFGAVERMRLQDPTSDKIWHAEIQIGDSVIAIAGEEPDYNLSPASLGGSPVIVQLYVEDVDLVAERAVAAGAKVVFPVKDQFYGDRSGRLADPFGHLWIVSTHKEDVSVEEMRRRAEAWAGEHTAEPKQKDTAAAPQIGTGSYRAEPHLRVRDAAGLIDFLKRSFEAQETSRHDLPGGAIAHAEVRIGDSTIGIGDADDDNQPMPTALHLYVSDADAVYERALAAGAVSTHEPTDQDYGDREAGVRDPSGNNWYIATHKSRRGRGRAERKPAQYIPEGMHSVTSYLHPRGTDNLIDFLKRAFDATEAIRVQPPGDIVHHAKIRIGDSMVEMGEAHGPYGPMPTVFHLYVDETDAVYRRALAAGGISLGEPTNQAWGMRSAGIEDPSGNQWWINAPIAPALAAESASSLQTTVPQSLNPVMPFMFIREPVEAVEFYKQVFGARELMREAEAGGIVSHVLFQIGQSLFMISNPASQDVSESGEKRWVSTAHELGGSPVHLYLQVEDVDGVFSKAVAAGGKVLHSVGDKEWGDRVGGFEDPYGHVWYVATPLSGAGARPPAEDK